MRLESLAYLLNLLTLILVTMALGAQQVDALADPPPLFVVWEDPDPETVPDHIQTPLGSHPVPPGLP